MGIVKLRGRDGARLSTGAPERERRRASRGARGVAPGPVVGFARLMDGGAKQGAGHSAAERTCVRGRPRLEEEGRRAS